MKLTAAGLKNLMVTVLKEYKATEVTAIKVKQLTDVTDYMIIATANSTTHVKALVDQVKANLAPHKIKPISIEGEAISEWMLADYGNVVLHVMLKKAREYYKLEQLWGLEKLVSATRKEQIPSSST